MFSLHSKDFLPTFERDVVVSLLAANTWGGSYATDEIQSHISIENMYIIDIDVDKNGTVCEQ